MFKIKFAAEKPKRADFRGHSLLPDYTVYELTLIQKTLAIAVGGLLLFGVGYLFYHHWIMSLLLMPGGLYAPRMPA